MKRHKDWQKIFITKELCIPYQRASVCLLVPIEELRTETF